MFASISTSTFLHDKHVHITHHKYEQSKICTDMQKPKYEQSTNDSEIYNKHSKIFNKKTGTDMQQSKANILNMKYRSEGINNAKQNENDIFDAHSTEPKKEEIKDVAVASLIQIN